MKNQQRIPFMQFVSERTLQPGLERTLPIIVEICVSDKHKHEQTTPAQWTALIRTLILANNTQ